jgi:hypothetical protein
MFYFKNTVQISHAQKHTLGLAGQPGGPDFFVSMQDSSMLKHADACFTNPIDGFETVDRMHQQPPLGEDSAAFGSMIAIVSTRIIPNN